MFSDSIRAQRCVGAVSNGGIGAGEEEGCRRGSEGSPPQGRRQQDDDDSSDICSQYKTSINQLEPPSPHLCLEGTTYVVVVIVIITSVKPECQKIRTNERVVEV